MVRGYITGAGAKWKDRSSPIIHRQASGWVGRGTGARVLRVWLLLVAWGGGVLMFLAVSGCLVRQKGCRRAHRRMTLRGRVSGWEAFPGVSVPLRVVEVREPG